ncbi:MAG: hydantoinase/oxoprolinase family protein [Pseudomonadota bacterium]
MHKPVIGWDVGGAHLKAALLDENGRVQQVLQVPCALWRGLNELEAAIDVVLNAFNAQSALHAITMTGELVDLFQSRKEGVLAICQVMEAKLNGSKLFYAGALNADLSAFVPLQDVAQQWPHIASANWLASASFAGKQLNRRSQLSALKPIQHGLLIDIGSTTADFVLLKNNQATCIGFTDAARMQSEELVYMGVVRTPLMAVAQKIQFQNTQTSTAAEYFATTADVYRLTGDLLAEDDMADTADGKEKTPVASARRIARMIGHDVEDADMSAWLALANEFKLQQLTRLKQVAQRHLARLNSNNVSPDSICVVGAGAGAFLAKEIAQQLQVQYVDIAQLIEINMDNSYENTASGFPERPDVSELKDFSETSRLARVCLPAYAVAYLAFHQI